MWVKTLGVLAGRIAGQTAGTRIRGRDVGMLVGWAFTLSGPASSQTVPGAVPSFTAWNARIIESLKLDTDQQAALLVYEAALAPRPVSSATTDQLRAMSLPTRLDYAADHMALDVARLRTRADAARHFYAALSAEQQKLFDAATAPPAANLAPSAAEPDEDLPAVKANYRLPSHTDANWQVMPSGNDLARVYPSKASRESISGRVVLDCVADEAGYLTECVVRSEAPEGEGFGNAALEMTAYMRMRPATEYGVPIRSPVTIPIKFEVPGQAGQPTTPSPPSGTTPPAASAQHPG
jgi:TonB family protein